MSIASRIVEAAEKKVREMKQANDDQAAQMATIKAAMALPALAVNNFLILPSNGGARLTFSESSLPQLPPEPRTAVVMPTAMLEALSDAIINYLGQVKSLSGAGETLPADEPQAATVQ